MSEDAIIDAARKLIERGHPMVEHFSDCPWEALRRAFNVDITNVA